MNKTTRGVALVFLGLLLIVVVIKVWPSRSTGPDLKVAGWAAGQKVEKAEEEGPIDRVDLAMGGEKTTLTRGAKGRWTMTPPDGALVDRYKVRQILDLFKDDLRSVMSSRPIGADLSAFGLNAQNAVQVTLYQGGSMFATLEIGAYQKPEDGMGEGDSFVRMPGQDRVYRIIQRNLHRPFEDGIRGLRDKKPFDFEASDVTAITISNPADPDEVDRAIELVSDEEKEPAAQAVPGEEVAKKNRVWRFAKPVGFVAGDMRSFASAIAGLYVQEYLAELPSGLAIGADAYAIKVTLAGGRVVTLRLSAVKDDAVYGKVDGVDGFLKLSKSSGEALRKRVGDLRDKSVFGLKRDRIAGVSIVNGPSRLAFVRDEGGYRSVEPAGLPLGRSQVDALLADIEALKADSRIPAGTVDIAAAGLAKPIATMTVTLREGGSQTLVLGAEKEKGKRWARLVGGPDLLVLPDWAASKLRKGPADLRNKRLFEFDVGTIASVEIAHKNETLNLVRGEGAGDGPVFKAVKPELVDELKPEAVKALTGALTGLTVKDFVVGGTPSVNSLASSVDFVVAVTLQDGTRHEVRVSDQKKDSDPYAWSPSEAGFKGVPFSLNAYQVQALRKRLADLR